MGVVATRMTVVATPRVPLTRMFHAAHRPSDDSAMPSTSTCSPPATNGRNRANATNGSSMTRRRTTNDSGTRAWWATSASTRA